MKIYLFDINGNVSVSGLDDEFTISDLKNIGKQYNGVLIPLNYEAFSLVSNLGFSFLSDLIDYTIIKFDNGSELEVNKEQFMIFSKWFLAERNSFFVGAENG